MPCYHPLKGFKIGLTENGKDKLKIVPYNVNHLELIQLNNDTKLITSDNDFRSPYAIRTFVESVPIPCGQCIGCRLDYSRRWADRCMLELQYHSSSWFVTLTYDEEHEPFSSFLDESTGEVGDNPTLVKKDFQLFMKRLRKNTGQDLRYFACGEYGGSSARPHYHAIIYGLDLPLSDLVPYKRSPSGEMLYNSKIVDAAWQGRGFAVLGSVSYQSCAYVSRYICKKLKGEQASLYSDLHIQPEFTLMSRKPGIGKQYYLDHPEMYNYEYIYVSTYDGGKQIPIPKYFDHFLEEDDPAFYESRKTKRRELSQRLEQLRKENTSLSYLEMLQSEELYKQAQIKSLSRKEV